MREKLALAVAGLLTGTGLLLVPSWEGRRPGYVPGAARRDLAGLDHGGQEVGSAMPRYAAFLRGVMPMNAKMAELKASFEAAGFTDVKTVLSSGNVVFSARAATPASLERKAEAAMTARLGRSFQTIVRSIDALRSMLALDPYEAFRLAPGSKRVVTFLPRAHESKISLPIELDGARILLVRGGEVFSAYVPNPRGPVFMALIEKTFGKEVTTRTWDTVGKVAR